ncbi:hypothetical protein [Paenibacillus ihuae]|nr:hypothetical protein [Paenibacillus ihuae]
MGKIEIALGGGIGFSAPAWFILLILNSAIMGIDRLIKKVKN